MAEQNLAPTVTTTQVVHDDPSTPDIHQDLFYEAVLKLAALMIAEEQDQQQQPQEQAA